MRSPAVAKRNSRPAARRTALSPRMKRIREVKKVAHATRAKQAAPGRRAKTAAQKEALSLRMKELWAKRKAEAAKQETEAMSPPKDVQSQ